MSTAHSLPTKLLPSFKALRSTSFVITSSVLQSFYLSRSFFYVSPGWFPFFSDAQKKDLKIFRKCVYKAISDWSFLLYCSILLLESLLSRLEIALNYHALSFLSKPFPGYKLPFNPILPDWKKRSPWRSFCSVHESQPLSSS